MPSFCTIFVLATAVFATFSSAAPTGTNSISQVAGVLNGVAQNAHVDHIDITGANIFERAPIQDSARVEMRSAAELLTRDDPVSLPTLLNGAKISLETVLSNLNQASYGKPAVDLEVIVGVISDVQDTLSSLLDGVELLVENPIDVILTLEGNDLTIVDIAALLNTVLSLVCIILGYVLRIVPTTSLHHVTPLIADIGAVLCELLASIFQLVPTLLSALLPVLGPILNALISLSLDTVVNVLKIAN